jgi:putative ABC transport system ATP-binding protein
MGAILQARGLVKEYVTGEQTFRALDGLDLEVEQGSFTAIMGPSGSGKSTLLHLLGLLDRPTSGEVLLDGQEASKLSDAERTRIRRDRLGFVFQFFNLIPVLSIAENVSLPAAIAGRRGSEVRERLDRALASVGLSAHGAKLPSQVSGGEQQRAAIARALFSEPVVLLADEPTGNLDTTTSSEILGLLRDAQRDLGQTVVVVTHDPRVASSADRVVLLEDGRILDDIDVEAVALAGAKKRTRRKAPEVTEEDRAAALVARLTAAEH